MNQYVFVLNEMGERITSFVDNMISKDELLDHAKKRVAGCSGLYLLCRW